MSLSISIIGIDGSGKSTVTAALTDLAPAELGITAAAVGEDCRCKTPDEDLLLPGFAPEGESLAARLNRLFRSVAKLAVDHPRIYPPLKLVQLVLQEWTARQIESRYHPDVIFCDGSLLLSSAGRAINYSKSNPTTHPTDPLPQVEALYDYVRAGKALDGVVVQSIPGLKLMRGLRQLDLWLNFGLLRFPDAVIFLEIAPETALARLQGTGRKLDRHENLHDLTQAQRMYRGVVEFFRRRKGASQTAVIDVTGLSVEQTLNQVITFVRTLPFQNNPQQAEAREKPERLGTTREDLTKKASLLKKVLTFQYLGRYVLPNLSRGSAHELTFPLSSLGQLSLREGYSAEVMKAIYLQDSKRYDWIDRIFLDYPIHQAIYQRLQILKPLVERELQTRLASLPPKDTVRILTAPSGYAFDLFQPLPHLANSSESRLEQVCVLASDLDADGAIEAELSQAARQVGVHFEFVRGDLTSDEVRNQFWRAGPFDVVMFVGLSAWISKINLLRHLKLIRTNLLAPGGVLFTDCFTPHAFALSGKYLGYKVNYYAPRDYVGLLAYCGFDPAHIRWESGPEGINHVCVARLPACRRRAGNRAPNGLPH